MADHDGAGTGAIKDPTGANDQDQPELAPQTSPLSHQVLTYILSPSVNCNSTIGQGMLKNLTMRFVNESVWYEFNFSCHHYSTIDNQYHIKHLNNK